MVSVERNSVAYSSGDRSLKSGCWQGPLPPEVLGENTESTRELHRTCCKDWTGRLGASLELAYRHCQQAMCAHMYPEAPSCGMYDGLKLNLWDSMSHMFGNSTRGAKSQLCVKICSGGVGSMCLYKWESLTGHRALHADMPSPIRSNQC